MFPAKAQRSKEKENTPLGYLGSFAPLREMFGCGSAALRCLRLGVFHDV